MSAYELVVDTIKQEHRVLGRSEKGGIGFGADVRSKDNRKDIGKALRDVQPEDLIKYGLI